MENTQTPLTEPQTPETSRRIVEYAELVSTLQLSIAREMNVPGALEAQDITDILKNHTQADAEHLLAEIGQRFDEALLRLVGASLVANRHRKLVIVADTSEGINGYLPWQHELERRVASKTVHDIFSGALIEVERPEPVEDTPRQLGKLATLQAADIIA